MAKLLKFPPIIAIEKNTEAKKPKNVKPDAKESLTPASISVLESVGINNLNFMSLKIDIDIKNASIAKQIEIIDILTLPI